MNICFTTSECVPYAKTGGLADVAGSLPKALQSLGCRVKVFMPLYDSIHTLDFDLVYAQDLGSITVQLGGKRVDFHTWFGKLPDSEAEIYFIDCPTYYHRGSLYTSDDDEHERFILLQHAAFQIMQRYHWAPDIIHANDWHTALMPVMLKTLYDWDELFRSTGAVITIHNIGYQGRFGPEAIPATGLSSALFQPGGNLSFQDSWSFLEAGIVYADLITTVSQTYAREIQQPEFGAGLQDVLRYRRQRVEGVVNGIDTDVWDPSTDPELETNYDAEHLDRKLDNKRALLREANLNYNPDIPVVGVVSRLTQQKGLDLLEPVISGLTQLPMQFVFLGSGEDRYEQFLRHAAHLHPDAVSSYIGYNEGLAHRITAGADMILMPSRYEPCGMNQMFALLYGTVPVVRKTGGLADTVRDYDEFEGGGNGFSFEDFSSHALYHTLRRAAGYFRQPRKWTTIQRRGMEGDYSWNRSASRYLELYEPISGTSRL